MEAASAFCLKWEPILPCPDEILRVTGHSATTSHGNSTWVPLDCSHQDLTQEAEPCLSPLSQAVVTLLLKLPPMGWAKNAKNNPLCTIILISLWANSYIQLPLQPSSLWEMQGKNWSPWLQREETEAQEWDLSHLHNSQQQSWKQRVWWAVLQVVRAFSSHLHLAPRPQFHFSPCSSRRGGTQGTGGGKGSTARWEAKEDLWVFIQQYQLAYCWSNWAQQAADWGFAPSPFCAGPSIKPSRGGKRGPEGPGVHRSRGCPQLWPHSSCPTASSVWAVLPPSLLPLSGCSGPHHAIIFLSWTRWSKRDMSVPDETPFSLISSLKNISFISAKI